MEIKLRHAECKHGLILKRSIKIMKFKIKGEEPK
jgi:hypothetical protein